MTFLLVVGLTQYRYLFTHPGPKENTEKHDIKLDTTMGGQRSGGNSKDPNDHAFGFYIMSDPENEITSVSKRDGSHWDFFDCDNTVGEKRQTIKAVCTDSSDKSNCDIISRAPSNQPLSRCLATADQASTPLRGRWNHPLITATSGTTSKSAGC